MFFWGWFLNHRQSLNWSPLGYCDLIFILKCVFFFFFTNMQKTKKYQEGSNTTNWMFMDDFRIFSTRNLSFCSNIYTIKSVPRDIILDDPDEGYRLRRVGWAIKLFIILQVLLELLWNWMFASLKQSSEWFAKKKWLGKQVMDGSPCMQRNHQGAL